MPRVREHAHLSGQVLSPVGKGLSTCVRRQQQGKTHLEMIHKVPNFSDRARLQNGVNLTQLDPQELLRGPVIDFYLAVDDNESRATISIELDGFHHGKRPRR